ncbi:hypothetical protein K505DRAFT_351946 [Melanomma pulvis-pyrius CBS 109.77]|uniref:Uncharacterized protein n=1 Tax=Melanomma pulvis-pyrius CBS 109.77 TaxID=1314802 RepID=A0A6A6X2U1_9PLEO|nr:hypothetical protein K505DRAFT_351946 [Melanomma pulvis-pyrius CBS 109.77]
MAQRRRISFSPLLLGAIIQCLLSALLPRNLVLLPAITAFSFCLIKAHLIASGHLTNPLAHGVNLGCTTTQFPAADGTPTAPRASSPITILVLAATFTHPNGRFCPGGREIDRHFVDMWKDAEKQHKKYGYLGNTPALTSELDNGLHAYGARNGDDRGKMMAGAGEKFRHIGIMHETYEVPQGHWENISHNFRPFGICHAQFPVELEGVQGEKVEGSRWVSGLKIASGKEWKSMETRIGMALRGIRARKENEKAAEL